MSSVPLAGALLSCTGTAIAAPSGWARCAVSHARGQHAVVVVSGNVNKPRYLAAVTSYPHQQQKMTVFTYPDSRTMSADAQLADDTVGTLYVSLWARHWR